MGLLNVTPGKFIYFKIKLEYRLQSNVAQASRHNVRSNPFLLNSLLSAEKGLITMSAHTRFDIVLSQHVGSRSLFSLDPALLPAVILPFRHF
jgi:hypothetical protein